MGAGRIVCGGRYDQVTCHGDKETRGEPQGAMDNKRSYGGKSSKRNSWRITASM